MDEAPQTHKRKPILALLLSIWTPGLGQIYNGRLSRGFVILGITITGYLLLTVFNIGIHFYGLILALSAVLLTRLYGIIDAIIGSVKAKQYSLKKYNTVTFYIVYGLFSFGVSAVTVYGGVIGIQLFTVPTTSNSPTLQPNDYIVMDKRAYDSKAISCGDLVAYNAKDGKVYIGRIIGLPGDTLNIKHSVVTLNNRLLPAIFKKNTASENMRVQEYIETLPNGIKHNIYRAAGMQWIVDDSMTTIVPDEHYFLLGDNRDYSFDSRQRGAINKEDIIGQVIYVAYREGKKRKGTQFNIELRPQTK
jgi:signal peptidase I